MDRLKRENDLKRERTSCKLPACVKPPISRYFHRFIFRFFSEQRQSFSAARGGRFLLWTAQDSERFALDF